MKRAIMLIMLVAAVSSGADDLQSLRAKYDDAEAKIKQKHQAEMKAVGDRYLSVLGKMKDGFKKNGDVQGIIASNKERERFARERDLPFKEVAKGSVAKAQVYITPSVDKVDAERNKRMKTLLDSYIGRLTSYKKELTMADKLDDALKVATEIKKVGFISADVGSRIKAPVGTRAVEVVPARVVLPVGLSRGLALYYGFDRDEKDKVTDKSGKGNHGKVRGAKWVEDGKVGGSLDFDGRDDYVSAGPSRTLGVAKQMTRALWMRPTARTKGWTVLSGIESKTKRASWRIYIDGVGRVGCDDWKVDRPVQVNAPLPLNAWTHIVSVRDGSSMRLYVNGALKGKKPWSGVPNEADSVVVGVKLVEDGAVAAGFVGQLDEVMAWSRALSETEVKRLFERK